MSISTISRGTPQFSGRYVCYVDDFSVATKILTFVPGTGWLGNDNKPEPPHRIVNGWLGPLPVYHFDKLAAKPSLEFDL